ncbi:hypothetical protein H0X06_06585 [Candidatus Dependentiae bacterium]|nr:hypothetical protein [Candidatus Dependentiae bacterium]
MNIQKKSVFLALMSVFCLSINADLYSLPYKAYAHTTICLISSVATVQTIHDITGVKYSKDNFLLSLFSIMCGYTAYRSGLSAYTFYKKACLSKKSLQNSSETATLKEKPNTQQQSSSLKSNIQEAAIQGDTSL